MSLRIALPAFAAALLFAGAASAQTQGPNNPPPNQPPPTNERPPIGCDGEVCYNKPDQTQPPLQDPLAPPSGVEVPANLTVPPPPADAEAERQAGALPITGSGNGDLWTPPAEPQA